MFESLKEIFTGHSHNAAQTSAPDSVTDSHQLPSEQDIVNAIKTVYDPEISVNVYDLGLIYMISISPKRNVSIQMTLTAPSCPVAGILPGQVGAVVESVEGVDKVSVQLVWDPPWSQERISEEAQLSLGLL